jgi:DNA sulfur modification protein DndD
MNSIFLEMIGADPEQGAIIRRAEISPEFDIIVYGPNDRTLNPDRDLNGASRRALTLAFILALTKVSEVEAPNVIDTPLGMTSGYVKRSILRTAVRESAQLVLFLTHDEIAGCEDIIDEAAGVVFTLTNPAHYPKMLVNDPHVKERKVLRCECDHRNTCRLCQRRTDAEAALEMAS